MVRKAAFYFVLIWTIGLLTLCASLAEADDPVVVRVGDFSFTKSQLQSAVDTDIQLTETLAQVYLTDAEKQAHREIMARVWLLQEK